MRVYRIALREGPILSLNKGSKEFLGFLKAIPCELPETIDFEASFHPSLGEEVFVPPYPSFATLELTLSVLTANRVAKELIAADAEEIQWTEVEVDQSPDNYWILNPCGNLVPLDEKVSRLKCFKSSPKVMKVEAYAFEPADVEGKYIFRASIIPRTLLCTEDFKEDATKNGWDELRFVPVWDDSIRPFGHRPKREEVLERPDVYGPGGFHPYVKHLWPDSWSAEK